MHIFLYGLSGSGKSSTGKALAETLKLPFIDLDIEIERFLGKTISQFMSEQGERDFREIESNILQAIINNPESVIALGGGALLRDENCSLVQTHGQVVLLQADFPTLIKRLSQDVNQRPLLAGDLESSLKSLLESRKKHYALFPLRVDATGSPEQTAWNIQVLIGRFQLRRMGPSYDIWVENGGLDYLGENLSKRELRGPVLVLSDSNVAPLYANRILNSIESAGIAASKLVIPAGEAYKNIETVMSLWRGCLEANLDRKSTIIALGGGVVGDLAGFTAATYMRGCHWVAVPTTLLAMVDASLGGKTGFDLPQGKNLVGAFHPPRFVLADPQALNTLPARELRAGLAEVVKHGVIADPDLFRLCNNGWDAIGHHLPEIVKRAMAVKINVIEEDPYEQGIRAGLNLGHTVGHAVELVSKFRLLHGEAVSIGMVIETKLAERLSIAEKGLSMRISKALSSLGLPVKIPENLPQSELIRAMKVDKKKSAGIVQFSLPEKIGAVKLGVDIEDLTTVFEDEK